MIIEDEKGAVAAPFFYAWHRDVAAGPVKRFWLARPERE